MMNREEEILHVSKIRDSQSDTMIDRFKKLVSEDRLDDAFAIADEFFEWLHPDMAEQEETLYSDEQEIRKQYIQLTEG